MTETSDQAETKSGVAMLPDPPEPDRPFLAYGLLRRGELAHRQLEPYIRSVEPASISGTLRLRDGLPILVRNERSEVRGDLIEFIPSLATEAWRVVTGLEPPKHYRWDIGEAVTDRIGRVRANVLLGKKPSKGVAGDAAEEWTAGQDPVLAEGLEEVRRIVRQSTTDGFPGSPYDHGFWSTFFRLQSAYLLLWSVVERYTALRFGPALETGRRVAELDEDNEFREAVRMVGAEVDSVVDSRDPKNVLRLNEDGSGAAKYFYGVRSNLSHRGKSAFKDARLLLKVCAELHDTMRVLLELQLPAMKTRWSDLAEGSEQRLIPGLRPGGGSAPTA